MNNYAFTKIKIKIWCDKSMSILINPHRLTFITWLIGGLLNLGCQGKVNDLPKHEDARNTQTLGIYEDKDSKYNKEVSIQNLVNGLQLDKIKSTLSKSTIDSKDEAELFQSLAALRKIVLDVNIIYSIDTKTRAVFRESLYYFNQTVLKLSTSNKLTIDNLKDYFKIVFDSCSQDFSGCKNLRAFGADPGTHQVLLWSAKQVVSNKNTTSFCPSKGNEVIDQYYCFLFMAFETKSHLQNEQLSLAYLSKGKEYLDLLKSRNDFSSLERHQKVFENIFLTYNASNAQSQSELKKLINEFEPWLKSNITSNDFKSSTWGMMDVVASDFFYADPQQKVLSDKLKNAIEKTQSSQDHLGVSFRTSFENSLKQGAGPIYESFGISVDKIKSPSFYNEYFYIIDRWYRGHTNLEFTEGSYLKTGRDLKKLAQLVQDYSRVTMLILLIDTKTKMKELLSNPENFKGNIMQLMNDNLFSITDRWKYAVKQFEDLSVVLSSLAGKSGLTAQEDLRKVEIGLVSLRKDIRTLIAGPSMLMMSYFYAKNALNLKIYKNFSTIKQDGATLIESLLASDFANGPEIWFDFGNQSEGLNRTEVLMSFLYALQTNIFESYGGNDFDEKFIESDMTVSRMQFLELIKDQLFSKERSANEDSLTDISSAMNESKGYLTICENLKSGNTQFKISLPLTDLDKSTGFAQSWEESTQAFYHFYLKVGASVDAINKDDSLIGALMGKFQKKNKLFTMFVNAFEDEAKIKLANKPTKLKELLAKTSYLKQSTIDAGRQIVREILQAHNKLGSCFEMLYQLEVARQKALIEKEEQYLRSLFREIKTSVAKYPSGSELKQIERKYKFTTGQDQLSIKEYTYSKYDLLLRMSERLKTFSPAVETSALDENDNLFKQPVKVNIQLYNGTQFISENEFVQNALTSLSRFIRVQVKMLNWGNFSNANQVFQLKANTSLALWSLQQMSPEYFTTENSDAKISKISDLQMVDDWMSFVKSQLLSQDEFYLMSKIAIPLKQKTMRVNVLYLKGQDIQRYFFDEAFETIYKMIDPTDFALEVYTQNITGEISNFKLKSDAMLQLNHSVARELKNTKDVINKFMQVTQDAESRYSGKLEYQIDKQLVTPVSFVDVVAGRFVNYEIPKRSNRQYILFDANQAMRKKSELEDFIQSRTNGYFQMKDK